MIKGSIEKVECEPYQHTIKETGEVITLNHKYEYKPEDETVGVSSRIIDEFTPKSNVEFA